LLGNEPVKSIDFIVHGPGGSRLLIDVKGRRFPGGSDEQRRWVWESWSTREDVAGLERWVTLFGPGYLGLLVFAYDLQIPVARIESRDQAWTHNGRRYLFRAVDVADYRRHMRSRSPRWGTVDLSGRVFRQLVRPFHHFSHHFPVMARV
jgi:hypothetical protein